MTSRRSVRSTIDFARETDVIEKIPRHCGLWPDSRPPPGGNVIAYVPDDDGDGDTALFDGTG
jgi:hypothetical protein